MSISSPLTDTARQSLLTNCPKESVPARLLCSRESPPTGLGVPLVLGVVILRPASSPGPGDGENLLAATFPQSRSRTEFAINTSPFGAARNHRRRQGGRCTWV
jgi:hypothetical protein